MTADGRPLDAPPERIGGYRLGRKIGEGGMGAVYLAEHELLGRHAAIKLLHDRYAQRSEIVERFFNEARAATAIADQGIVQIFDFGNQDGRVYIVMELLEGEMLDARLDRLGRLPVSDVLRLSRQLALSLYAAHQRGVIHRDLKPENIVIISDAEAAGGERTKILDFGIAKLVDADQSRLHTQTGLMMGTPHYMSPEQCRGAGSVDHRADIYSLGCLMFRLLTGETVFAGEGAGDLVVSHVTETPRAPSSLAPVPPGVDAIVARCLAKSAADRFPNMRQLALEIDDALRLVRSTSFEMDALTPIPSRSMIAALPAETAATMAPDAIRARRWPIVAVIGAVAIAALVVGGIALHGSGSSAPAPVESAPLAKAPPAAPPAPAVTAPGPAVTAPAPVPAVAAPAAPPVVADKPALPPPPPPVVAPPPTPAAPASTQAITATAKPHTVAKPAVPTAKPTVKPSAAVSPADPYADR